MQRAGGEVLYARRLGAETFTWMAAHPTSTARLAVRHLLQTLFPPRWYWIMFADSGAGNGMKQAINWIVSALGLIGVANALVRLDARYRYPAIMTCVTILPFMLVQPTLRYRYLVFAMLVFSLPTYWLAFQFVCVTRLWLVNTGWRGNLKVCHMDSVVKNIPEALDCSAFSKR